MIGYLVRKIGEQQVSMKRHLFFFIAAACTAFLIVYFPIVHLRETDEKSGPGGEIHRELVREARLVEYFCFGKIPPTSGRAVIPSEWEKALGTTIKLREGVGEVASLVPELAKNADALRVMVPGQSVFSTSRDESGMKYALVYKPNTSGAQYLYLSKTAKAMESEAPPPIHPALLAVLLGIGAALLLTILASLVYLRKP